MGKANKHRGGRPPGQRNREYAIVEEIPAACPACGGTNLTVIPGSPPRVMDYAGGSYDRIVWRNKICECGQHVCVRTREKETKDVIKT